MVLQGVEDTGNADWDNCGCCGCCWGHWAQIFSRAAQLVESTVYLASGYHFDVDGYYEHRGCEEVACAQHHTSSCRRMGGRAGFLLSGCLMLCCNNADLWHCQAVRFLPWYYLQNQLKRLSTYTYSCRCAWLYGVQRIFPVETRSRTWTIYLSSAVWVERATNFSLRTPTCAYPLVKRDHSTGEWSSLFPYQFQNLQKEGPDYSFRFVKMLNM